MKFLALDTSEQNAMLNRLLLWPRMSVDSQIHIIWVLHGRLLNAVLF